jgi:hypothetical protein
MAGLDYLTAESKLALWLDAEEKVASGQSVSFDGRQLTRANLAEIGERISFWDQRCKRLNPSRHSLSRAVAR